MLNPESKQNDLSTSRSTKGGKDFVESFSDSGFLSGPQGQYSSEFDSGAIVDDIPAAVSLPQEKRQASVHMDKNYSDSGCLDDISKTFDSCSKDQMGISSGIEGDLTNKLVDLHLKDSSPSLNNFNAHPRSTQQKEIVARDNLWKLCYQQDDEGDTQLHIAILNESPYISVIIDLAPQPGLLDIKNDDAQTSIHLATLTKQPSIVRQLLIAGAKATIRDGDGNTPLHLACLNNDEETVKAILEPMNASELKDYNKCTNSSYSGQRIPIDLEQRNYNGENCIHIATQNGYIQIIDLLIRAGADINAREGRAGYTPLHIAVEQNNPELVNYLLSDGKHLNIETLTYGQRSAYQLAGELQFTHIMNCLEKHGCILLPPPFESDFEDDSDTDSVNFDSDN